MFLAEAPMRQSQEFATSTADESGRGDNSNISKCSIK